MKARLRKLASRISAPLVRRAAASYVAGAEVGDALKVAHQLRRSGYRITIGFWNGDNDSPRHVADAYLQAIVALHESGLDHLSIKLPALDYSQHLLSDVLCAARSRAMSVHFDSLGPETAERTFAMLEWARASYANLSVTIPTSWRRSLRDIDWAMERQMPMRIVKGQWPDQGIVDPTKAYTQAIKYLAGRVPKVAIATHDPVLARESLDCLRASGTAGEMELLYGLPRRPALAIALELQTPVAFYIPYGHAWLPYCLSQAQQNPRILWWMLKDSLLSGSPGGV